MIVGLPHHDNFLKTADETIRVVEEGDSECFSVVFDVGGLRVLDVYEEIENLMPYTCSWQLKEEVWYGDKAVPIGSPRLRAVTDRTEYHGFLSRTGPRRTRHDE